MSRATARGRGRRPCRTFITVCGPSSTNWKKGEITSIALPKLATGVGGLDWTEVKPLVQSHLGGLKIPVFVYTEYHKGVQATEPGI